MESRLNAVEAEGIHLRLRAKVSSATFEHTWGYIRVVQTDMRIYRLLPSRKLTLTWKPKKGPIKTTVPLKWGYRGFHVSLGDC